MTVRYDGVGCMHRKLCPEPVFVYSEVAAYPTAHDERRLVDVRERCKESHREATIGIYMHA